MESSKVPPVTNPGVDVAQWLRHLMGDTGEVQESMGGLRIHVYHTRAFPWGEVLKALVYREFRVYITRRKADLFIEASV